MRPTYGSDKTQQKCGRGKRVLIENPSSKDVLYSPRELYIEEKPVGPLDFIGENSCADIFECVRPRVMVFSEPVKVRYD